MRIEEGNVMRGLRLQRVAFLVSSASDNHAVGRLSTFNFCVSRYRGWGCVHGECSSWLGISRFVFTNDKVLIGINDARFRKETSTCWCGFFQVALMMIRIDMLIWHRSVFCEEKLQFIMKPSIRRPRQTSRRWNNKATQPLERLPTVHYQKSAFAIIKSFSIEAINIQFVLFVKILIVKLNNFPTFFPHIKAITHLQFNVCPRV